MRVEETFINNFRESVISSRRAVIKGTTLPALPSLRKQLSFLAPGPSGVSGRPGAKKDGCFCRLPSSGPFACFSLSYVNRRFKSDGLNVTDRC